MTLQQLVFPLLAQAETRYACCPVYNRIFQIGPAIVYPDVQMIPQGLTTIKTRGGDDWLVTSLYLDGGRANKLVVINRVGGQLVKMIDIAGSHAGGLATSNNFLWVADPTGLYGYTLASLVTAPAQGGSLQLAKFYSLAERPGPGQVPHTSFVTYAENHLWLGQFNANEAGVLDSYEVDVSGQLRYVASRAIPSQTQGIEFTPNYLIYSRSNGRADTSRITLENRSKLKPNLTHIAAPGMPEDMAYMPALGVIYISDESSAMKFRLYPQWTKTVVNTINYVPINSLLQMATS